MQGLLVKKPLDQLLSDSGKAESHGLKRVLGPVNLIALGVGAVIGAGIFVFTGSAAARYAGPAISISFVLAGVGCAFAGLCYAELASMIPISGSAYTYAYATLGELIAWIIGWDLILEYAVSNVAVAIGFGGYLKAQLGAFGLTLPDKLSSPVIDNGWT